MKKLIPNLLTLSRIPLGPAIVVAASLHLRVVAFCLVAYGPISDGLDGWLARRWQVVSDFGKNIDPPADAIYAAGAFFGLVLIHDLSWWWIPVLGLIFIPLQIAEQFRKGPFWYRQFAHAFLPAFFGVNMLAYVTIYGVEAFRRNSLIWLLPLELVAVVITTVLQAPYAREKWWDLN